MRRLRKDKDEEGVIKMRRGEEVLQERGGAVETRGLR